MESASMVAANGPEIRSFNSITWLLVRFISFPVGIIFLFYGSTIFYSSEYSLMLFGET